MDTAGGKFWVYTLENAVGRFYIGHTDDVARRLSEHNSTAGHITFTHKNGPWVLVWSEEQRHHRKA